MTTEALAFRLREVSEEKALLLLSKASGVPLEIIERVKATLTLEELTADLLNHLMRIAEALEASVLDLLATEQKLSIEWVKKIIELLRHQGITIPPIDQETGRPDPRWFSSGRENGGSPSVDAEAERLYRLAITRIFSSVECSSYCECRALSKSHDECKNLLRGRTCACRRS